MSAISQTETEPSSFTGSDRIFLGEGLFETLRVSQGQALFAERHWQRMQKAADVLGITFALSPLQWQEKLNECIKACRLHLGGIKVLLSGGIAPRGLTEQGYNSRLVFEGFQYQPASEPIRLVTAPWRRDACNPVYRLKSVNYLEAILACRSAQKAGASDVLFFNTDGNATETSVANLFVIHQQTLFTPPLECGVLDGITRARILEYCRQTNIPCSGQTIDRELIAAADALFITNSLQGIRPVSAFDGPFFQTEHPLIETLKKAITL